jgi:hypothetical protein
MFIDGIHHSDEQFRRDAEGVSKYLIAGYKFYQDRRSVQEQDGNVTAHVLLAATAFTVGVLIKDQMLAEHGA